MFELFIGPGLDISDDVDDASWMFRAFNDLGDDSHVLLRPMRRLIGARKPPGHVTPLVFSVEGELAGYFGALYTGKERICFYPAYPRGTDMTKHTDHITLEIGSRKSHATRYDDEGIPHRHSPDGYAWRLFRFPDSPMALWFQLLIRWEAIEKQDTHLQRGVDGKSVAGGKHVESAFIEYAAGIQQPIIIPVHPSERRPNYALFWLYYGGDHPYMDQRINSEMLTLDGIDGAVTGWTDNSVTLPVEPIAFSRGGYSFVGAAACPPGELKEIAQFGFPRKKS